MVVGKSGKFGENQENLWKTDKSWENKKTRRKDN